MYRSVPSALFGYDVLSTSRALSERSRIVYAGLLTKVGVLCLSPEARVPKSPLCVRCIRMSMRAIVPTNQERFSEKDRKFKREHRTQISL